MIGCSFCCDVSYAVIQLMQSTTEFGL